MEAIAARVRRAIQEHVFPGCVIGILTQGDRQILPFGRHTYDVDSPEVAEDSLYDLASVTKSVVTTTLALQLVDGGVLDLDESLTSYLPEYAHPDVTIRHLLTHTVSGLQLSTLRDKTTGEIVHAACTAPLAHPPGTHFAYTNLPAFLLGLALERIIGPLDQAGDNRIFKPLGMSQTTFWPHGAVPTEEGVQDIVHDESARVFAKAGKAVGHAGMFSTALNLLTFCENLLQNHDPRLETNQLDNIGASAALAWELNQPWMGEKRTKKTFGKTGFTGTSIVCDFERKTAIVILSNRTYPKRPPDRSSIDEFRADVCDIITTLI